MAEFPAFTIWTDAYLGDTGHLTTVQHGAYLLLLIAMWRNGGVLPNDEKLLAKYCRLPLDKWRAISPTILAFMQFDGKWITQKRLVEELKRARQHRQSKRAGAKAMWLKRRGPQSVGASIPQMDSLCKTIVPKERKITTSEYDAEDAPLAHLTGERRSAEAVPESGKREERANGASEIPVSAELAAKLTKRTVRQLQ